MALVHKGVFPKEITQVSNTEFQVAWTNGVSHKFDLAALQQHCLCARCFSADLGERREEAPAVDKEVKAHFLESVGLYGLKIAFTSGCQAGIFSYPYLYELGERGLHAK